MRLLLASNSLARMGGSETYLLTLARDLERLGHEVDVLQGPGAHGALATEAGLHQVPRADALRGRPDRAIVQDAIVAADVAAAWPDVPQLFVVHSTIHDLQLTSAVPSTVGAYVALNDLTATRARALAGDVPVVRLRQPIDVDRFRPAGPPPAVTPERLLLFGNNAPQGRHERLVAACTARGIAVERLGTAAGRTTSDPVADLRRADIVVGYGRCILEAMACGRTALVFDRFGSDGWVDADTYDRLESTGFNGLAGLDEPGRVDFGALLDSYDAQRGWAGLDLIRRHHNAKRHAVNIVEVLDGLGPVAAAVPDGAFSMARVWREQWRWETTAIGLTQEVTRLSAELEQAHGEVARLRERLDDAEQTARDAEEARRADALIARQRDAERVDAERRLAAVVGSRRYRLGSRIADVIDVVTRRGRDSVPPS